MVHVAVMYPYSASEVSWLIVAFTLSGAFGLPALNGCPIGYAYAQLALASSRHTLIRQNVALAAPGTWSLVSSVMRFTFEATSATSSTVVHELPAPVCMDVPICLSRTIWSTGCHSSAFAFTENAVTLLLDALFIVLSEMIGVLTCANTCVSPYVSSDMPDGP